MSNHIDHIEITNFKSIRHQKIEGCKRINVFIGYPNVGKSAILEAISVFSYSQSNFHEPYNKLCRFRRSSELFYDGNIQDNIKLKYSDDLEFVVRYEAENAISLSLTEKLKHPLGAKDQFRTTNAKEIYFVNDNIQVGVNQISSEAIVVKKYQFQNKFNENKTDGLKFASPNGENLVDIVHSNKELRKEIIELFQTHKLELNIDQRSNSIFGYKRLEDGLIYTIPFYQMADTLQRLIFHKAAIMSNKKTVLLFEEPEAHMFPPYIKKFTGDIIFNKQNDNQYFISTHSPFVLDDLIEDAREDLSVYLVGIKKGETVIKRLSDKELEEVHKLHVDLFFNIESYLD